jgi:hypothetical protein
VVLRLTTGILAVTFLPLGLVFVVLGLVVDEPDRGEPETFIYVGAPLAVAGAVCAVIFTVLWRREAARRRRRRQGLRTSAEIVSAHVNWAVRVNGRPALRLTVRFAPAGTVSGTFVAANDSLAPGDRIEVMYDPLDPSNFEPVAGSSMPVTRFRTARIGGAT